MVCRVLGCSRRAVSLFRIERGEERFLTASCEACESTVQTGNPFHRIRKLPDGDLLAADVMEAEDIMFATKRVLGGHLMYEHDSE